MDIGLETALDMFLEGISINQIWRVTGLSRDKMSKYIAQNGYETSRRKNLPSAEVCKKYNAGASQLQLAKEYNVAPGTIGRVLDIASVEKRPYRIEDLPIEELVANYLEIPNIRVWKEYYGVSDHVIKSRLIENNIKISSHSDAAKTKIFDERSFSSINSEERAYWLGFMFADGCVSSKFNDVSIRLAESEIDHVKKFAKFINYNKNIDSARIDLRSERMKADLISYGCTPLKSLTLQAPDRLPQKYESAFIRGVNDGDGYVGVYKKNASIEIVGSKPLLEWIAERMPGGLKTNAVLPHKNIWRVRTRRTNVLEFARYMYKDATVYLDRKYNKYLDMEKVYQNVK